jgi:uncharacterized Fe-S radical SAM superfamily protein PflX
MLQNMLQKSCKHAPEHAANMLQGLVDIYLSDFLSNQHHHRRRRRARRFPKRKSLGKKSRKST